MNTEAKHAELDHMPREVATALLTTPGVKMTAAMRRSCKQARLRFMLSLHPIVKVDGQYLYEDTKVANPPAVRYTNAVRAMNASRLAYAYSKVLHRRRAVQYLYERCDNEAGCNKYNAAAMALDMKRDCLEAEINRRATRKAK